VFQFFLDSCLIRHHSLRRLSLLVGILRFFCLTFKKLLFLALGILFCLDCTSPMLGCTCFKVVVHSVDGTKGAFFFLLDDSILNLADSFLHLLVKGFDRELQRVSALNVILILKYLVIDKRFLALSCKKRRETVLSQVCVLGVHSAILDLVLRT
jgi:hypothetical protein